MYTPLHIHSDASLLDGLSKPKDILNRINEIGAEGCALTDHGVLSNCVQFLKTMEEGGKKPVVGIELYICNEHSSVQTPENRKLHHLVILAKNQQGYQQLLKIVSASNTVESYYYKPRLSLDELSAFLDGNVIGFSGHLGSHLANISLESGVDAGVKAANYFQDLFGKGNFWLEVQLMDKEHNPTQIQATELIREISKKTNIPIIATPDAHYAKRSDAELQRILLCSNMHVTFKQAMAKDFQLRGFFVSDSFHIPSYEEMLGFGHTEEELSNTNLILEQIEKYNILSKPQLPKFECPSNMTDHEYLTQLCRNGWKKFFSGEAGQKIDKNKYVARIQYELGIIEEAGLSSYFLIVQDIVKYVNSLGYLSGVSRGSAGGCLVSYLIEITKLDPIPYNLQFERFYNKARIGSLPDIDLDIEADCREEIIEYIRQKYGNDKVGQLITFQNIKGSKALSEVFRAYGEVSFEEVKRITKNIIEEHKITDELQAMKEAGEEKSIIKWCLRNRADKFKEWCEIDDEGNLTGPYAKEFDQAIRLEGVKSAQSKHAAGVVIGSRPLNEIGPLVLDTKNKKQVFGLTMDDAEAVGLVKMDLLGLTLLDKMHFVKNLNPEFETDIRKYTLDDKATWDLLKSGKTKSCFQLESQLGQSFSKKLKPENLEHLAALSAILRPGCLEAVKGDGKSVTEHYIKRKNNEEAIEYIHEALEPILKATYGELIYQEGAAQIAKDIAGFTPEEAQLLIKAIGKKKADVMAKIKTEFAEGVAKMKIVSKEIGDQIFGWIEASQRYGFNKSHAVGYSLQTYLSAYAKVHYPLEFFTSYLYHARTRLKPQQEIYEVVNDAKYFDIFVQPPSIQLLNARFQLIDGKIYFGLTDIKHVGESVIDAIKESKVDLKTCNWLHFLLFVSDNINSRSMAGLINAGAMDCFKLPRIKMLFEYNIWSELSEREKNWVRNNQQNSLLEILKLMVNTPTGKAGACYNKKSLIKVQGLIESINNPPYELVDKPHQIAQYENTLLGICLTATFLDESKTKYKANCSCQEFNSGFTTKNAHICLAAQVDGVRMTVTKKGADPGREMAFLKASDETGIAENLVIFPDSWDEHKELLVEGNRVLLSGKRGQDKNSLIIDNVEQI